jgi:HAMP domain-containing protein
MTIRTKLVGAFLLMALLVPVIGSIALARVRHINDDVETLSRDAVPTALLASDLDALQREQQRAVYAYFATGAADERQRYDDLVPSVDQRLAELMQTVTAESGVDMAGETDLVAQVTDERTRFDAAARQLINARAAIEQQVENVRVKAEEMVLELTILRNRFSPAAASSGAAEGNRPSAVLQNQVSQLLFGMEGMMSIVAFEAALSSGYTITLNPALRQRFEDASAAWANFLQTAKANGGPEDRVILSRVEEKFATQFEPSARNLMATADSAAGARQTFTEASQGMSSRLDQVVALQSERLDAARRDAESTVSGTGTMLATVTVIAFALAVAFGAWFASMITQPLRQLRDVANRVSAGDLGDVDIAVGTRDEVGDLASALRRMVISLRLLMRSRESGADQEVGAAP